MLIIRRKKTRQKGISKVKTSYNLEQEMPNGYSIELGCRMKISSKPTQKAKRKEKRIRKKLLLVSIGWHS